MSSVTLKLTSSVTCYPVFRDRSAQRRFALPSSAKSAGGCDLYRAQGPPSTWIVSFLAEAIEIIAEVAEIKAI
jgi:hypothetical protein